MSGSRVGRHHKTGSGLNPSFHLPDGELDPGNVFDTAQAPVSRASSATGASTLDDVSASEVEASLSRSARHEEDDDYDEEDDAVADGDTTIAGPPSPATTLTMAAVHSSQSAPSSSSVREKTMTRRERKKLGIPKTRPRRVILKVNGQRPGSIRAPDGSSETVADPASGDQTWSKNGNGRMDVRGFRELKI